jgi:hypothetical protein
MKHETEVQIGHQTNTGLNTYYTFTQTRLISKVTTVCLVLGQWTMGLND